MKIYKQTLLIIGFDSILMIIILEWLRGLDSNQRPLGYEPNELPLLYPAKT